jgi:hypothetical protein
MFSVSKKKKHNLYSRSSLLNKHVNVGGMAAYRYMDKSTGVTAQDTGTFSDPDDVDFKDKDNDIEGYIGFRRNSLQRADDMKDTTASNRKTLRDSARRNSDISEARQRLSDPFDVRSIYLSIYVSI